MFPDNIADLNLAIASDIHLDHAKPEKMREFFAHTESLQKKGMICLVTGDLTTYTEMPRHLPMLEQAGIKFVLGNHDIWYSSFEQARARAAQLAPTCYLSELPWVALKKGAYLVGVDGYFDLRAGRIDLSKFETWDLKYNSSVAYFSRAELYRSEVACRKRCEQDANTLRGKIAALPDDTDTIVIATHVPPFPEVARYRGKPSEPHALPFYVNVTLGETLTELAETYSDKRIICLSGHTHDFASQVMAPNLLCMVSSAHYGYPKYCVWQ